MPTIRKFEDIEAWKTARELTIQIYELSSKGGFSRDYGLRDQIRRASVSAMSNIAEGFESQTQATFINYLGRAKASAGEVRSHLYIAYDLDYLTEEQFNAVLDNVKKLSGQIYRFMSYLKSQPNVRRIVDNSVLYEIE